MGLPFITGFCPLLPIVRLAAHSSPAPRKPNKVGSGWLPLRGAPAGRRVRGGPGSTNLTPTTPQSPSVTAPLKGSQMGCRGRRCGVAQRSMPQWGIEPHERASSARVDANLRVGRRGGFYIRPQCTRTCRGVGDAAPYTQPHGGCRGEQCSPEGFSGGARLPGQI